MNFNINNFNNEYELFESQTQEMINLYGIAIKLIKVKRVQKDYIFGESNNVKADNKNIFEFFALPQEVDNWDGDWVLGSNFGIENQKNLFLIVSSKDLEKVFPDIQSKEGRGFEFIIGNLIMLPDGKLMEIANFVFEVEGGNNLFPYANKKNVFGILCKPYYANHDDLSDLENEETKEEEPEIYESVESLEKLFETTTDDDESSNKEIEKISKDPEEYNKKENAETVKPLIENDPFGDFV